MPTIIVERGFRISVNSKDHLPPHVHVWKAGFEAKFVVWGDSISLYANAGMNERDLKTAADLCAKYYDSIVSLLKEMPWVK